MGFSAWDFFAPVRLDVDLTLVKPFARGELARGLPPFSRPAAPCRPWPACALLTCTCMALRQLAPRQRRLCMHLVPHLAYPTRWRTPSHAPQNYWCVVLQRRLAMHRCDIFSKFFLRTVVCFTEPSACLPASRPAAAAVVHNVYWNTSAAGTLTIKQFSIVHWTWDSSAASDTLFPSPRGYASHFVLEPPPGMSPLMTPCSRVVNLAKCSVVSCARELLRLHVGACIVYSLAAAER